MKKSNRFGFSIMELTITTVMIAVILVIAPVVILKRNTKPKEDNKHKIYIAACQDKCIYSAKYSTLKIKSKETEVFDYVKTSGGLYNIRLIGGGGGGTANSNGMAGEDKILQMHSLSSNKSSSNHADVDGILTGYYLMETGKGGAVNESGKPSSFCIITEEMAKKNPDMISCKDSGAIIIAQAVGGITSNEENDDTGRTTNGGLEEGLKTAGYGGEKNKSGNAGVIIIR